jgi:hypothetical protein
MKTTIHALFLLLVAPLCAAEWDVYRPPLVATKMGKVVLATQSTDGNAQLIVTCDPKRNRGLPLYLHVVAADTARSGDVNVRFDAAKPSREQWSYGDNYVALDANDAKQFVRRMARHKQLRMDVATRSGKQTAEFDVAGFERRVPSHCM